MKQAPNSSTGLGGRLGLSQRFTRGLVGAVALIATGSILYAQPGGSPTPTPAAAPATTAAPVADTPAPDPLLPVKAMLVRVDEMFADMARDEVIVNRLAQRVANDSVKRTCVEEKELLIKAQRNVADQASGSLSLAINNGDEAARGTSYDELTDIQSEVRRLREEAQRCIDDGPAGDSTNRFDGPNLPLPDRNPFADGIEVPANASPFS